MEARYDGVADFYAAGWPDDLNDPASTCLFTLLGPVSGLRVLEIACGHGRVSRELARRGAAVAAVDVSGALVDRALAAEQVRPLGVRYTQADAAEPALLAGEVFDAVVCCFGLSDIDDLDGALDTVRRTLRQGGLFVWSILHPCFGGGAGISASWPTGGRYHDEGWWRADGEQSTLRRQVGAHHRTLATYFNALRRHGLTVDEVAEPDPAWVGSRADAGRSPVFLVVRCVRRKSSP
ncbi:MAG TPA: methyltransferase domain-containing protein [Pseudonocardiaceae bacterium]|nr:methyltransferase domain-containing protein [Pseudonocardiaceae bacterium]